MDHRLLEYSIDRDGRYVDANEPLLDATGYTLDELRGLVVGQLSTTSPDVARELWQRFLRGEIEPRPLPVLVRRKDGRLFDALFLDLKPAEQEDRWVVRLEAVRLPRDQSARSILVATLEDWRAAERQLASLPEDAPLREVVEAQIRDLRDRYRQLQA